MIYIDEIATFDFDKVPIDPYWNVSGEQELKMHRIHSYPAKFPAFIATKAMELAKKSNLNVKTVGDVFCGCGTSVLESRRNNLDFWGCDINPVATLIAKVKSRKHSEKKLNEYFFQIESEYKKSVGRNHYAHAPDRLKYWFKSKQYNDLFRLKAAINQVFTTNGIYKDFFFCAFSNILKSTSVWLTKSIKPQVDPNKKSMDVFQAFKKQFKSMKKANSELRNFGKSKAIIKTTSFLNNKIKIPSIDLIITSPPYVTSYEYADLHQLSTLWLDFVDDYRDLRTGTIGSLYHQYDFNNSFENLNITGKKIVGEILLTAKEKAKSVTKYFLDMQNVTKKIYTSLSDEGMALFVIGNTEFKGVRIDNAKHLSESLFNSGFTSVNVTKRKISRKILTPYRDKGGKFTTKKTGNKIYSEEYILIGKK